ncbi:MAG: VanZ family protein [Phycisphaerae bacterium]|nr:VanZ family protein [Phycisphaerae bacterium]
MSDKTMHFLAYLGLAFFAWLAVSPGQKVNWLKPRVWIILTLVAFYGIMDEVLQGFVGRSADVRDFAANMIGVLTGLVILTFLSFWSAALLVSAIFIMALSNMARIDQITGLPFLNVAFHFCAYGGFSLIWIQYLERRMPWETSPGTWFAAALSLPAALLIAVKVTAPLFGRPVWRVDLLTAVSAILFAAVVSRFVCRTLWLPAE